MKWIEMSQDDFIEQIPQKSLVGKPEDARQGEDRRSEWGGEAGDGRPERLRSNCFELAMPFVFL